MCKHVNYCISAVIALKYDKVASFLQVVFQRAQGLKKAFPKGIITVSSKFCPQICLCVHKTVPGIESVVSLNKFSPVNLSSSIRLHQRYSLIAFSSLLH